MATAKKTVRLNKNARAWVKALRSGKYKQTKGFLTDINPETGEITGHCCLGVACELALKAGVPLKTSGKRSVFYDDNNSHLPLAVQKWLGLASVRGNFTRSDKEGTDLTIENDINGKSFKQIARIIEQKAAELFV